MAEIDNSFVSEKPVSLLPSFTTANNEKITINSDLETAQPCHFLKKPPILVFFQKKENQPPEKKIKVQQLRNANNSVKTASTSTNFITSKQTFESTSNKKETKQLTSETKSKNFEASGSVSIETLSSKNLNVRYDNFVFYGNVINDFYFSNGKLPEQNM